MSASLFVGNLPWETTSEDLAATFQDFSPSDCNVVFGRNGRSRGYGIVKLGSAEDAERAIEALNGTDVGGRSIVVRHDKPPATQAPRNNNTQYTGSANAVFCGNLSWGVDEQQLTDFYIGQGFQPQQARITRRSDGRSRGWGLVFFADEDTAQQAISVTNGVLFEGRELNVHRDEGPTARK